MSSAAGSRHSPPSAKMVQARSSRVGRPWGGRWLGLDNLLAKCALAHLAAEISLGAPKWAIHVKTLLNDLLKLIKGTFHLFGLGLSDLKGDFGSIFCASSMAGILVFCPLTSHSARSRNFGRGGGEIAKCVQWAYIKLGFRVCGSQGWGRQQTGTTFFTAHGI